MPKQSGALDGSRSSTVARCPTVEQSVADLSFPPRWIDELSELLRFPSVSADPAARGAIVDAMRWVETFVDRAGGGTELAAGSDRLLAVSEVPASDDPGSAPTILLYGHVDVQPPDPVDAWESPPFEPAIRNGWLYARGATDNKGNFFLLLKALELLAADGRLPVNVRVICDGEEEIGGEAVVDFLRDDPRGADALVSFDSNMPRPGLPALCLGLRGLAFLDVSVRTGTDDLHSGVYGGAALNAVHALNEMLAAVIPLPNQLRQGAVPLAQEEVEGWAEIGPGDEQLAAVGAVPSDARASAEFATRTVVEPSIDVHGISAGSTTLVKTIVPVEARAFVSIRIAPGQDEQAVAAEFERLLRAAAPSGASVTIESRELSPAVYEPPDTPVVRLAQSAFEASLGRRPILMRSGGGIPFISAAGARGIPFVLTGFGLPESRIHAPNERFDLSLLRPGVDAARALLLEFGKL
jgi:acetylornithine deacetylase/succinyl-diaminopimelate desuccinylase-like protein